MWNSTIEAVVTIALGILAVAMLAVAVSKKSATASVIQSAASGFANSLGVALTPITGTSQNIDTSYPNSQSGLFGTNMGTNYTFN